VVKDFERMKHAYDACIIASEKEKEKENKL
jgi:hypothetical protein